MDLPEAEQHTHRHVVTSCYAEGFMPPGSYERNTERVRPILICVNHKYLNDISGVWEDAVECACSLRILATPRVKVLFNVK
jgi:hypothetical protein